MKTRSIRTITILFVGACVGACLTGCHISRPAAPNRVATATLPGPEAWPTRDIEAVRGFAERTPDQIFFWEPNGLVPPEDLAPDQRARMEEPDRTVIARRLTDHGLLRVWNETPRTHWRLGISWFPGSTDGFESNASFLTERDATGYWLERALKDVPDGVGTPRGEKNLNFPGLQRSYAANAALLDTGVPLQVPTSVHGRGVAVVLGGYMPSVWEDQSVALFAGAGWDVLLVDPRIRVRRPNDDALLRQFDARTEWVVQRQMIADGILDAEGNPIHYENAADMPAPSGSDFFAIRREANEKFPLPNTGFELTSETDPAQLGTLIAESVDDTLAENAYAVAAAVGHLVETFGSDAVGPIAVIGYSAGSFGAPAVAARLIEEGHEVGAMILIGAGADIFEISQSNPVSDGGIDLVNPGDLTIQSPERKVAVHKAYLSHTRLDPYIVAPALADIPTLLMIANDDQLVPNGTLLDERLGYPDRIRYFGGHGGLFYFLPQQTPRMIRWLDRAVSTGPKSSD